MQTYHLVIAYRGDRYAGWQRQDGFDTVQERLEAAMHTICAEAVVVHGAGRTDAGVHALRQSAHVRLNRSWPPQLLQRALNGNLPEDIRVTLVQPAPRDFHARFSAVGKRYAYCFATTPERPVFGSGRCHWVRRPLDLTAMREAAASIVGEHDFAAFATNPGYVRKRGTVRRVEHLHLFQRPHRIDLVIQGNGFLYNMVRTIAGTLKDVGLGRLSPADVAAILESKDRRQARATIEPCGLYLVRVLYPDGLLGVALDGGDECRSTSGV